MKYCTFLLSSIFILLKEGGAFSPIIRQASVVVPSPIKSSVSSFQYGRDTKNVWKLDMSAVASSSGEEEVGTGTAGMASMIFNLVKSVVGVGVLSLPAGTYILIEIFIHFN